MANPIIYNKEEKENYRLEKILIVFLFKVV